MVAIDCPLFVESTRSDASQRASENLRADSVTRLTRGASARLAHLSDSELLTSTQRLVGRSNQILAALLEHLAEVEARGLYRERARSSLYGYCIYELRFSEDAAARRSSAAKLALRFPVVLTAVRAGEIHLTGLLMLGPHLTDANHVALLALAKFRTKKEIFKLIRRIAPLPLVPDRIEALGEVAPSSLNPTWAEFIESLCPPVRELPLIGPRANRENRTGNEDDASSADLEKEREGDTRNQGDTAGLEPMEREGDTRNQGDAAGLERMEREGDTRNQGDAAGLEPMERVDPARRAAGESTALARCDTRRATQLEAACLYQMQFTTVEEHAELVECARALLSHRSAKVSLGELHLRAMRLLVESLEKARFGSQKTLGACDEPETGATPRQRGRYVPARLRRAVYERDGGRCAYVDERGAQCGESRHLEVHHLLAFARGGEHQLENLTLRCRAHNALAAEQDFGREHVERQHGRRRHESERHAERGTDVRQGLLGEPPGP